jgi:Ca2+-binding EF-hand superfamily protein
MGCSKSKASKAPQEKPADNPAPVTATGDKTSSPEPTDEDPTITLLRSLFERIDADADGKLDAKELAKALTAESSLEEMLVSAGYNPQFYVLEQLDGNQDGRVSWDEFRTCLITKAEINASTDDGNDKERTADKDATISSLKAIFAGIDADSNGKLDAKELAKALKSEPSLEKMLEKAGFNSQFYVLEQLDTNQDGTVSWDEFEACLKKASAAGPEPEAVSEARSPQEPPEAGPTVEDTIAPKGGCCF